MKSYGTWCKNLQNQKSGRWYCFSLAALGNSNHCCPPIMSKGTIGIEVPNKNRDLSLLVRFWVRRIYEISKDLPIALGRRFPMKFVRGTKMPHLLMAGTLRVKSLWAWIWSCFLDLQAPFQLKFVLVDPKRSN
jgi:hypothetical protein